MSTLLPNSMHQEDINTLKRNKVEKITCIKCGKLLCLRTQNEIEYKYKNGKVDLAVVGTMKIKCPRCRQINKVESNSL